MSFLESHLAIWSNSACCVEGKRCVIPLCAVNDYAERGITLLQQFNLTLTKDDGQWQYLLQVFKRHHKEYLSTSTENTRGYRAL